MAESAPVITVSAVVLQDDRGWVLLVRKRGTRVLIFPGGKPEAGESARAAAQREVAEELGVEIPEQNLHPLGRWETAAANEDGHRLIGEVFAYLPAEGVSLDAVVPRAEIAEIRWVDPGEAAALEEAEGVSIAPLTRDCVFPSLLPGMDRLGRGHEDAAVRFSPQIPACVGTEAQHDQERVEPSRAAGLEWIR